VLVVHVVQTVAGFTLYTTVWSLHPKLRLKTHRVENRRWF